MRTKEQSNTTRINNLKRLIADNTRLELGFSRVLLRRYVKELSLLVVKREQDKRDDHRFYNFINKQHADKTPLRSAKVQRIKRYACVSENDNTLLSFSIIGFNNYREQIRESIKASEERDRQTDLRMRRLSRKAQQLITIK